MVCFRFTFQKPWTFDKNKVKRLANGKYWIYYNTALPSK